MRSWKHSPTDKAEALDSVERYLDTKSALGQSLEHVSGWTRAGIEDCLTELKEPIHHDWVLDPDPDGLVAKAEQVHADRQQRLNAGVMAQLLRPSLPKSPNEGGEPSNAG